MTNTEKKEISRVMLEMREAQDFFKYDFDCATWFCRAADSLQKILDNSSD